LLTLSDLAKRNRTIILSLHQPRSDAFGLFTKLLVLSKGSVVYSGLTTKCLPWFASLDLKPDVGVNPLDFLIDVSSVEMGDDEKRDASRARVERLITAWKDDGASYTAETSNRWGGRVSKVELHSQEIGNGLLHMFSTKEDERALQRPGLLSQTITLTRRCVLEHIHLKGKSRSLIASRANKNTLRNYGQTLGYTVQSVVVGLMLGGSYFRLKEACVDYHL
jgi:ATP-binding cassette, subfamily G (WHITE), member 8 (sterolin 2)